MTHLQAAEGGYQTFYLHGGEWTILLGSVATALLALLVGFFLMKGVLAQDEGTDKMKEIAKAIQEGAMAYLKRQFKTIGVILVPLAVIVFLTSTKVKTDGLNGVPTHLALSYVQSGLFRTAAFVLGCFMSGATGVVHEAGVPLRPSISTRQSRHEPNALSESVAHSLGMSTPPRAAARITEVPAGTLTAAPSISTVIWLVLPGSVAAPAP